MWDSNTIVYHYTTLEAALEHILSSRMLKMGTLGELNDPRDSKKRSLVFASRFRAPGVAETVAADELYEEIILRRCRVFCGTEDDPAVVGAKLSDSGSIEGRGFALPTMWRHYGGGHRGVCLAFDRDRLYQELKGSVTPDTRVFVENVEYGATDLGWHGSRSINADMAADLEKGIYAHIEQHRKHMFFLKARDWSYEREVRFLAMTPDRAELWLNPSASLKGIVLGENFPTVYLDSLSRSLNGLNVPIYRISWWGGVPAVTREEI